MMKGDEGGIENIMLHGGPTRHAHLHCLVGFHTRVKPWSYEIRS